MDHKKLWVERPPARRAAVTVVPIDAFDARGMRQAYGRRDHMCHHHTFEMDVWVARDGRVLMRCSSRCIDIEGRSFEITGLDVAEVMRRDHGALPRRVDSRRGETGSRRVDHAGVLSASRLLTSG